jgi:hypothetical protein
MSIPYSAFIACFGLIVLAAVAEVIQREFTVPSDSGR